MSGAPSNYLQYLPQILRGDGGTGFLDGYLRVFEALLSGRADTPASERARPLDATIASFPERLDPALCPIDAPTNAGAPPRSAFLDYLARWVALTFDQNWDLDKRRAWLGRIVSLYKRRGTRDGLNEYLRMFVGDGVRVEEPEGGFIVGTKPSSVVGVSTFIADAPAHYFRVRIDYGFHPNPFDLDGWKNLRRSTRTIVDMEKPAHTYYSLHARAPGIIVGGPKYGGSKGNGKGRATIGKDTLIWRASKPI